MPKSEEARAGTEPAKAKMAPAGIPPANGGGGGAVGGGTQAANGPTIPGGGGGGGGGGATPAVATASYKRTWWRRGAPCLAFLAAFSTAMTLLLVWSEAAALRRQAFDANMTRDYVLNGVSMDNPVLVALIREVHLKPTTQQDPLNATQTSEEKYVAGLMQRKREGVYVEYIGRIGAVSSTGWLESNLSWRGVVMLPDPRSFFEAQRGTRNPKTRVLHACLSTDKFTKEITYRQESEVQVTKLGEGPNNLVSSDEGHPTTRLMCFPLYSVLLAYNATVLDYLSLDSPDAQDGQALDAIPWDTVRISVLSIRWSPHHSEAETKSFIDKMTSRRYKLVHTTDTGKWVFLYNTLHKI